MDIDINEIDKIIDAAEEMKTERETYGKIADLCSDGWEYYNPVWGYTEAERLLNYLMPQYQVKIICREKDYLFFIKR